MQTNRWHWMGISLVGAGVLISWASVVAAGRAWGVAEWGVLAGGLLALAGLFWFRRRISTALANLERREDKIRRQRGKLREERREFQAYCEQLRNDLKSQAAILDQRQQDLTRKLALWHEWMEFPEPIDLTGETAAEIPVGSQAIELARSQELAEKDRRLNELLEAESKLLFDNILRNKYTVGGQFQPALLRDDAYALMRKVAQIYRPHVEHPLLETSLEQLLRAASRACLHFLVVLESLPVKAQQYNIKNMYGWVKQGVRAYGVYKSAQPYFPYASSAYYLTRFAMGANPISLLAWWMTSEVASRTASSAARQFVHQRSLALLHDVVRVIGFEVAGIFGGHVRRRDANWIYGVELTEMLSRFPLSRDSLSKALQEVGSIQLLNEYDRIFLYRCLASHKSAGPQQYAAIGCLSGPQSHAVAKRLERFFAAHVYGKTSRRVDAWRDGAERRLGVKLKLNLHSPALSAAQQAEDALGSLAGFFVAVKQIDLDQLDRRLREGKLPSHIERPRYEALLAQWQREPPPFFEEPNLDPDSELAEVYLRDLVQAAVRCPPRNMPLEPLLHDVGACLRRDVAHVQALLNKQVTATLREEFAAEGARIAAPPEAARAALWFLEPGERLRFVYDGVSRRELAPSPSPSPAQPQRPWWLVGSDRRMFVVEPGEIPTIVWLGDASAEVRPDDGRLIGGCLLRGGTWLDGDYGASDAVHLRGQPLRRFESYFGPLLEFCKSASAGSRTRESSGNR